MRKILSTLFLAAGLLSAKAQTTQQLGVMPLPQYIKTQGGNFIWTDEFTVGINGPASDKVLTAVNNFYQQAARRTHLIFPQEHISGADNKESAQLYISYHQTIVPKIGMDESYKLTIADDKIILIAATDIGALRGLETLYQLITPFNHGFYSPVAEISDSPRFKWRGIMIDVARHFLPMETLMRNIDAMAEVKMNVLHLHLSDDEGFRVESITYPKLQQLGSNGMYYTQVQLKQMVAYAHSKGIIVVPEFDLPGHCTSILAAYPFLASYPANYKPAKRFNTDTIKNPSMMKVMKLLNGSATPTINPAKETTYTFFDGFIKEMSTLFPDAYFHVGADENNGLAWKQNPAIVKFMKTKRMKNTDELQAYFVKRMYTIAKKYNKRLIGWEETFNPALPADVIVQNWKPAAPDDKLINNIIQHNNQVIVSAGYYLDLFMPAYIHYLTDPVPANVSTTKADKGILGAEAAIWSELVNADNEEIRVWPRAAVIAERLWSKADVKDVDDMYRRLWTVDFELNDRGLEEQSHYDNMIARWVNGEDPAYVKTLTDLYVPIRGYRRLMAGMFTPAAVRPNLTSPLVNIADMVHCDSEPRLRFRKIVADYLADNSAANKQQVEMQLQLWLSNHVGFNAAGVKSPYLEKLIPLSDNLSAAAKIGLAAINDKGSKEEHLKQLEQLKAPVDQVQLSILPEIEALITGKLVAEPVSYSLF